MASTSNSLFFLNVPPKTLIGIDLITFTSSLKFRGVRNIPSGLHFVYTGTDASLAIRHGIWLDLPTSSIEPTRLGYALSWDADQELLHATPFGSSQGLTQRISTDDLNPEKGLVEWDALLDGSRDAQTQASSTDEPTLDQESWQTLTNHITVPVLSRILSPNQRISSVSSAPADLEHIPGLSKDEVSGNVDSSLNFTVINLKQTWPASAIGRERTENARDRSWYLGHLLDGLSSSSSTSTRNGHQIIDRQIGARALLGELQLCFVMVLTIANYSCLEQWKRILTVLFTCQSALMEVEAYFVEVVRVLLIQIKHVESVEGGMFDLRDDVASAWLRHLLSRFRKTVDDVLGGESKGLAAELRIFENFMNERYGWEVDKDLLRRGLVELEDGERVEVTMEGADEDEETGEYAPVIVEM